MQYEKCWGLSPEERFVTSSSSAFKPFSERQPQQNTKPRRANRPVKSEQGAAGFGSFLTEARAEDTHISSMFQWALCQEEKGAQNWKKSIHMCSFQMGTEPNSTFFQSATKQQTCCAPDTSCPDSGCFKMQAISLHIPGNTAHPHVHAKAATRKDAKTKPLLTEYQVNYFSKWFQQ